MLGYSTTYGSIARRLEPTAGVEPAFPLYRSGVLPLDDAGEWSPLAELNHRLVHVTHVFYR